MTDAPDWVPVETAVGATTASVNQVDTDVLGVGVKVDAVKASTDTIQTKVDNVATQVTTVQTKVDNVATQVTTLQGKVDALTGGYGATSAAALKVAEHSFVADGVNHTWLAATAAKKHTFVRWVFFWDIISWQQRPRGLLGIQVAHTGGSLMAVVVLSPETPTVVVDIPAGAGVGPTNAAVTMSVTPLGDSAGAFAGAVGYWYDQ